MRSGPDLTVVGFAFDLGETADAWVAPVQMTALRATATRMLFRFTDASTPDRLRAGLAEATDGLPPDALSASRSYLTLKDRIGSAVRAYTPCLMAFGILGIVVAVLIVANVVSGAVISGFRHIGILKALGFTPGAGARRVRRVPGDDGVRRSGHPGHPAPTGMPDRFSRRSRSR